MTTEHRSRAVSIFMVEQIARIAAEKNPDELLTLRNAYAGASRDHLLGEKTAVSVEAATDFAFLAEAADEALKASQVSA